MTHWHCENRGYLINAVSPNTPAVETWKTDNPVSYILNDTGAIQIIEEVNAISVEASKL
jgi:hypothetical protein